MLYEILLYSFLASVALQLGYLAILITGFASYIPISASEVPVSLIICSRNEEDNLKMLIPLLHEQKHKEFEIILVNDRSTDGTYGFLERAKKQNDSVRAIHIEHAPNHINAKKYALTLGIRAAKHDHLIFTDGDCIPNSKYWLRNMAAGFGQKEIVLGYSAYRKERGWLNYFVRYETLWTAIQYLGLALMGRPYMGVGRNLAYTRPLFMAKKGFNSYQDVIGGDDDLFVNKNADKVNTQVVLGKEAITISEPKKTLSQFFRQKLRHLSVGKHYTTQSKLILSIWTFSHLLFWGLFITLLVLKIELYIIMISFFIRTLLLHLTFNLSCKKLGERFELWGLLILDCIFVFYYLFVGVAALFTKRVKWI